MLSSRRLQKVDLPIPELLLIFAFTAGSFPWYASEIAVIILLIYFCTATMRTRLTTFASSELWISRAVGSLAVCIVSISLTYNFLFRPPYQIFPKATNELLFILGVLLFRLFPLFPALYLRLLCLITASCAIVIQSNSANILRRLDLTNITDFKAAFSAFAVDVWPSTTNLFLVCIWYLCILDLFSSGFPERTVGTWLKTFVSTIVLAILVLSFSRSIYLAVFLVSIAALFNASSFLLRQKIQSQRAHLYFINIQFSVAILAGAFLIAAMVLGSPKAMVNTFRITQSISQRRSEDGRILLYKESLVSLEHHLIVGSGIGSYPLIINRTQNPISLRPLVAHAFSSYLEVLIEQGLLGFIPLAIALLGSLIVAVKKIKCSDRSISSRYLVLSMGIGSIILYNAINSALFATAGNSIICASLVGSALSNLGEEIC